MREGLFSNTFLLFNRKSRDRHETTKLCYLKTPDEKVFVCSDCPPHLSELSPSACRQNVSATSLFAMTKCQTKVTQGREGKKEKGRREGWFICSQFKKTIMSGKGWLEEPAVPSHIASTDKKQKANRKWEQAETLKH